MPARSNMLDLPGSLGAKGELCKRAESSIDISIELSCTVSTSLRGEKTSEAEGRPFFFLTLPLPLAGGRLNDGLACCTQSRKGVPDIVDCDVALASPVKALITGGGSLEVSIDCSGLITLYASREKNLTFCPVPGVLGSRRMERTEPEIMSGSINSGLSEEDGRRANMVWDGSGVAGRGGRLLLLMLEA